MERNGTELVTKPSFSVKHGELVHAPLSITILSQAKFGCLPQNGDQLATSCLPIPTLINLHVFHVWYSVPNIRDIFSHPRYVVRTNELQSRTTTTIGWTEVYQLHHHVELQIENIFQFQTCYNGLLVRQDIQTYMKGAKCNQRPRSNSIVGIG